VLYSIGPDGEDAGGTFVLDDDGDVDRERADLPFFLDADRPHGANEGLKRFLEAAEDDRDKPDD
jgi:hypothetical protein